MIQGHIYPNNIYLECFKENIEIVELTKGNHILYTKKLMIAIDTDNPRANEIYNERAKFREILFLRISNEGRYVMPIQYLREYEYKKRVDYPTSVSGIYVLMFRHSGQSESGKTGGRKGQ